VGRDTIQSTDLLYFSQSLKNFTRLRWPCRRDTRKQPRSLSTNCRTKILYYLVTKGKKSDIKKKAKSHGDVEVRSSDAPTRIRLLDLVGRGDLSISRYHRQLPKGSQGNTKPPIQRLMLRAPGTMTRRTEGERRCYQVDPRRQVAYARLWKNVDT